MTDYLFADDEVLYRRFSERVFSVVPANSVIEKFN